MTSVTRLLAAYIEEHRRNGEADPLDYLDRASRGERGELAALIDAYLARAPRRAFEERAYRGSSSEQAVDALERAICGASGLWPVLLPRLRERVGLKRRELVAQLAQALGVAASTEKVARYYHRMEQGTLRAQGVSDRVLAALADLLGSRAENLRTAGQPLVAGAGSQSAARAFARTATPESYSVMPMGSAPSLAEDQSRDEVDALFTGRE